MKPILLQRGHSHASCKHAVALAAKSLLNKIPDEDGRKKLELTDEELEIVRAVIKKFGPQAKHKG